MDEEGFFEGVLRGKRGLVPSNMVELVTEPDQLDKIQELMAEQQCRSPGVCVCACVRACVCALISA